MFNEFLQQTINGLTLGSIYVLIALGLTILYGILGVVNWAHGEFYMLGAFVGLMISTTLNAPFVLVLLLSMLIMAVFGIVTEQFVFKPLKYAPQMNMIIATLGISIFLLNSAVLFWGPDPRRFQTDISEKVISIGQIDITLQRLLVVVVTLLLIVALNLFIKKTRLGKAMRACSQDLGAASLMGIDINIVSKLTTAISCMLSAAAGCLIGPVFLVTPTMGVLAVQKAFAVVILGGLGNIGGAIIAGYILGITESYTVAYISSNLKDLVTFFILIMTLIIRPQGIFGSKFIDKV